MDLYEQELRQNLTNRFTIAIDGPVASGKTVVGINLANILGSQFLDTGLMYRAITFKALERGVRLDDEQKLVQLTRESDIRMVRLDDGYGVFVNGEDLTGALSDSSVEGSVSTVSAVLGVRRILVKQQRLIAQGESIVMVGRDIGTIVLPDADLKIYLTASLEKRAERRYFQRYNEGQDAVHETILKGLIRRDKIDSERVDSPLKPAKDAVIFDTDSLSIDDIVTQIKERLDFLMLGT